MALPPLTAPTVPVVSAALPSLVPSIGGMQQQGSTTDNPDWIQQATKFFDGVKDCAGFQEAINRVMAHEQAKLKGLNEALEDAKIVYDFVQNPVSALTDLIKFLVKQYTPKANSYLTIQKKIVNTVKEIAQLEAAIGNAASRLTNCTITIPVVQGMPATSSSSGSTSGGGS